MSEDYHFFYNQVMQIKFIDICEIRIHYIPSNIFVLEEKMYEKCKSVASGLSIHISWFNIGYFMRNMDALFINLITQVVILIWTDFIGPKEFGEYIYLYTCKSDFYLCQSLSLPNLLLTPWVWLAAADAVMKFWRQRRNTQQFLF